MPEICVLDPDGDLVRYLRRTDAGEAKRSLGVLLHGASPIRSGWGRLGRLRVERCKRLV